MGLYLAEAQVGDVLCVLLGCKVPVVLRPVADNTYQVVSTCYAHGLMNGEAIYNNAHARASNAHFEPIDPETMHNEYTTEGLLENAGLQVGGKQKEYP